MNRSLIANRTSLGALDMSQRSKLRIIALEAFLAVIEHGGQQEAAQALGLSQSSISRHITDLESYLKAVLFTGDIPAQLTQKGHSFARTAQEVMTLLREARNEPSAPKPPRAASARDIKI